MTDPSPAVGGHGPHDDHARFDKAVDIVLNSAVMAGRTDDFWAFCDGEIDEEELMSRLR